MFKKMHYLIFPLLVLGLAACGGQTESESSSVEVEEVAENSVTVEEVVNEEETPALSDAEVSDSITDTSSEPELDLAAISTQLGVTEGDLMAALGDPADGPPDFEAAAAALGIAEDDLKSALGVGEDSLEMEPYTAIINGVDFEIAHELFTWDALPDDVIYERQPVQTFTNAAGDTHTYEAVFVSSGNLNWYQAAYLAQDAGGYLASITSEDENSFVFDLVSDEKFFWAFEEDGDHYGISIGPFLGGYQPVGSEEPAGGWSWLSGETWEYANWAVNLDDGVIDKDPRPNDQPNDSGDEEGSQPIMGFGEMNVPVPTWGDYMDDVGTYGESRLPGQSYGFVIEYENMPVAEESETAVYSTTTFQIEAWADNWFAAYLGEELIVEDSVSITTERSFNAETATFEASYPLNLNFILKDFRENDTGLEYIGERNQQMGDGGFIMQLTDLSTSDVAAVSNADWACTVIHAAPLDKSCESESNPVAGTAPCDFVDLGEPDGWKAADFDDSSWAATTVHSASDVDPKIGYDEINWDASAELIWGPDLETNNTILCRVTVDAP